MFLLCMASCAGSELTESIGGDDAGSVENTDAQQPAADAGVDTGGPHGDPDAGGPGDMGATGDAGATGDTGATGDMGSGPGDMGTDMFVGTDTGVDVGFDTGVDMGQPPLCTPVASGWQALGGSLDALGGTSDVFSPRIAIDDRCRPIVAWHEGDGTIDRQIYVRRWDGSAWQPMGSPLEANTDDATNVTALDLAANGEHIALSWAESDGTDQVVHVARWDGTKWAMIADPPGPAMDGFSTSLAIDSGGTIYVAWTAETANSFAGHIRVAMWRANFGWMPLGNKIEAADDNSGALVPSLVLDGTGMPLLAWQERSQVWMRRWSGSNWQDFGGGQISVRPDPSSAFDGQFAVSPGGAVTLAWREAASGTTDIFVRSYNGSGWDVLGDGIDAQSDMNGRTNTMNVRPAVDSLDRSIITWSEVETDFGGTSRVYVRRHDGTAFQPLGSGVLDVNGGGTDGYNPAVTVDPSDRVFVAFRESDGANFYLHVWRYAD
jgi:hypothetical protein